MDALARSVTEQLKAHVAAHPEALELHYGPNEVDPGTILLLIFFVWG